ncbi:MAG TPA: hypothetical protein VGN57_12890 [Pirellulaceae bacterium]|jgi:hypothetical protein|nr:hypothetical protein [Pirellulaceae bacterium]
MNPLPCRTSASFAFLIGIALCAGSTFAQLPATQLDGIFPLGASPSSEVELTIGGEDLDDVDKLVFSHGGISAQRKMAEPTPFDEGPQPVENVFLVKVAADVPQGVYEVRASGKYGLSNPRSIVVSPLAGALEVEPNDEREEATPVTLPAAVHGQTGASADVDWFAFEGKRGERLLIEAFARRLDSRMDVAMSLVGPDGSGLGEHRTGQAGDPLIDAVLPADGTYRLKVHDLLFGQGAGYSYRLVMGAVPHIDFVFPPAGAPGGNDLFTVYGRNLAGGKPSGLALDGRPLDSIEVRIATPADPPAALDPALPLGPHQAFEQGVAYRVENGPFRSNSVLVETASAPVVREEPSNDKPDAPQRLTLPCEVAGQFYPQRDADWYAFDAKKGEPIAIELWCQRLGLPSDPSLLVQRLVTKEDGTVEAEDVAFVDDPAPLEPNNQFNRAGRHEFDVRTADPAYVLDPKEDGTYRILVRDSYASLHSDPRLAYRLAVRPPAPDFRLAAATGDSYGAALLRKGGRDVIRVYAQRRDGYDGAIRVAAEGLPPGLTASETVIGPGSDLGTIVLTATPDAPVGAASVRVVGKGLVNGAEVARAARCGFALRPFQFAQPNSNIGSVPARVSEMLYVSVSAEEASPIAVTIGEGKTFETSRGGVLKIPFRADMKPGTGGSLTGFPMGIPPGIQAQQVSVGATGEFELRIQAAAKPGVYDFYLAGFCQQMQYARNPAAAEMALQRQERVAKIFADSQTKTQESQKLVQSRQTELNQATTALTQATNARTQADQNLKNAETALAQATADRDAKKAAAAAQTDDAALAQAAAEAEKKVVDAQSALEVMKKANEEAAKAMTDATMTREAAEKAKQEADAALQTAQAFQQQAQQEKQRADQFANQKKQESTPRGVNAFIPSNSVRITIAEFPIRVDAFPDKATVKQGEKVEVPIKIARLYEFNENVNLQPQPVSGVNGVQIPNAAIGAGQIDGKLEITAQPTATPGDHLVTVRFQMGFNGQQLTFDRQLTLTVVEVPKTTP